MKVAAAVACAILLAGCLQTGPTDADTEATLVPTGPNQAGAGPVVCDDPTTSCTTTWRADDCWDILIVFYLETERVNSFLPEGYRAESAARTYSRVGFSGIPGPIGDPGLPPTLPADMSAVGLVTHNCASASEGMGTMEESWVWAFVDHPPVATDLGLAPATLDIYELAHAGGSWQTMQRKAALGWRVYGDRVETAPLTVSATTGALTDVGHVFNGTEEVMKLQVSAAHQTPLKGTGVLRFWHDAPQGFSYADFDTGTLGVQNFQSSDFDCTMAAGGPAAAVTGYTSCDEAMQDTLRPPPTALINPSHDHPVDFHYVAR